MAGTLPVNVEFQIPLQDKYVALVRKGVRALASGLGFDERDCQDIEVAVGEAVTNAVAHSRPVSGPGSVRARCRLTDNCLIVDIEDEGSETCLPLPKPIPGASDEHGRGWIIIHRVMDRVSVRCSDRGLVVRMVKYHRQRGRAREETKGRTAAA